MNFRCHSGKFSIADRAVSESTCDDCMLGTEQVSAGMSYCLPCTPGRKGITDENGYNICKDCAPNYFSTQTEQTNCNLCYSGRSSDSGSVACSLCPAGWYVNSQSGCSNCLAGQYQDGTERSSCKLCSKGKISSSGGATSCDTCNYGFFMNSTGQNTCDICQPGTMKREQLFEGEDPNLYLCDNCTVGKFQDQAGQSSCFPCIPGKVILFY